MTKIVLSGTVNNRQSNKQIKPGSLLFATNSQSKNLLNIYKSSFVPKAIDEWNAIPLEIRQSSKLASFKNSLNTLKPTRPLNFSYGERFIK